MKRASKALSLILTLCMVVSLFSGLTLTAGAVNETDPVIPSVGTTYDVFLSKSGSVPYDVDALATLVGTKLSALIGSGSDTYRIKTATNTIDTTDLSGWYVYDHYDTAHYANQAAWEAVYGASSLMRPYQSYSEYYGTSATLAEMSQTDLTQFTTVRKLDQHIYSYTADGKPAMLFAGYGSPAYTDFLFYPATSTGSKTVNFSVNSAYVNTHTLLGAGFLINTGIDDSGYIHGYVLYYQFSSSTSVSAIYLYKINDNVLASTFSGSGQFSSYCGSPVTIAASPAWGSLMDIQLSIEPTSVKVEQKTNSASDYTTIKTETLTDTGYNGFGPLVQYNSHGCSDNSLFVFSNLAMSFQSDNGANSSSLLSSLKNAEFYDDSVNRVFVNLLPEDYGNVTGADKAILAVMRNKEIRLITNYTGSGTYYPTTYLGTNAVDLNAVTSGTAFGNGATTVAGNVAVNTEGMSGGISLDNLAANIAAAIYNKTYTAGQGTDPEAEAPADAAAALILRKSASATDEIGVILNGFIPSDGIKVYLDTTGSYHGAVTPTFTILNPGESEAETLTPVTDDSGTYFVVTGDETNWPAGNYSVTVTYGDNTLPATRTFKIAYSIKYAVDNGNTVPDLAVKYYGTPIVLADASGFSIPADCTFAGWYDGISGNAYASAASFSDNTNLDMTAKWQLAMPANVVLTSDNDSLELNWDAVAGAAGYDVKFYQDGVLLDTQTIEAGTTTASVGYTVPESGITRLYATVAATSSIANTIPNTATTAVLLIPESKSAPGGTIVTPYTQETINAVFGTTGDDPAVPNAVLTGDADNGFVITLNENVCVADTIVVPADVTLNLNGKYIIGADGANGAGSGNGAAGKDAVKITAGTLTVNGPGSINGGDGGKGGPEGGTDGKGGRGIGNDDYSSVGSIVINGAVFNGGKGADGTDGVEIGGKFQNVTVESGKITFESNSNYGLYAYGDVTIRGGTVNANGSTDGIYSAGTMTISGGTVTADGGQCGLHSSEEMTISGGTIDASGAAGAVISNTGITLTSARVTSPENAEEGPYSGCFAILKNGVPATSVTIEKYTASVIPSISIMVDGKSEDIGKMITTINTAGAKDFTVVIDQTKLEEKIKAAADASQVIVNAPEASGAISVELVIKNVEEMAAKNIELVVKSGDVELIIPSDAIDTSALLKELGATDSSLVPVDVTIAPVNAADKVTAKAAIEKSGAQLIVDPVEFTVTAEYDSKSAEVQSFNGYVQRTFEITAEQANKITTGIVHEPDGSLRHVPTYVFKQNGKYFATINCLTNSVYSLIYNEASFSDTAGTWYEDVVTEMASRKIVDGRGDGTFDGGDNITRAEFAAIVVRALGLPSNGTCSFKDVDSSAWYYGAVGTAYEYGIISGRSTSIFDPLAPITRQEAMQIIYNAAKVAEFTGKTGELTSFSDAANVDAWAKAAAKFNVGSGLIVGTDGKLSPTADITRGETATVVLRLLQNAELVDVRSNTL